MSGSQTRQSHTSRAMAKPSKSKLEQKAAARRQKNRSPQETEAPLFEKSRVVAILLFAGFAALVILVGFVGLSPAGPRILLNQEARTRIVAEFPFTYESIILTEQLEQKRLKRVPPVYRLTDDHFDRFEDYIRGLHASLDEFMDTTANMSSEERTTALQKFADEFAPDSPLFLNTEDLGILLDQLDSERRGRLLDEGLVLLRNITREGIYDAEHSEIKAQTGTLSFFDIHQQSGRITQAEVQSEEDALRSLRINLSALDIPREVSVGLYRILRNGIAPNLVYDETESEERVQQMLAGVEPVSVTVEKGQSIIEPGTRVNDLHLEQLNVYRKRLKEETVSGFSLDSLLWERVMLTLVILLSSGLYVMVGGRRLHPGNRQLALLGLVILLNIAIIRLILEMGESNLAGGQHPALIAILPFLAPVALGPLIVAILIGAGPGVFVALLISLFNAMMQGNSIPVMLVSFLSAVVGIQFCRNIQVRTRVVRAGALAGLVMALSAFALGLRADLDAIIAQQMAAALLTGAITGIVVVGILPILEKLFNYTTDISLLELTDFNHPLLRNMQVTAPGSYHHSLMVANLSENAADVIGANPLVCRVCSLYHDIGKTVKPEYFTENQQESVNPHLEKNPSMSALIIKSHVKEGVRLAKAYKLPQIIVNVIRQHHGSTLIQYFFYEALRREKGTTPPLFANAPKVKIDKVNESTYRYEGPKPSFKESAIIFFADSIEAASRSVRKVTAQSLDELIDRIFQERIDDDQLSDCPLTLQEIASIKKSFSFTTLNMLHGRVEYPKKESQPVTPSKRTASSPRPAPETTVSSASPQDAAPRPSPQQM